MMLRSLGAYLNERFPVVNMTLFAVLFLTVCSVAGYADARSGPGGFGWREGGGMLAVIAFFFRLRVFDEIKDYAADCLNHPHRVLQSGRISLRSLKLLAWAGGLLELAWSATMGWPALLGWAVAVAYSLLMRYEFFAGRFLQRRLVLYALTHLLIMPLVVGWIWLAYAAPLRLSPPLLLLAALSLLGGFSFEIARKLHVPAAERKGIDSYSRSLGYATAIVTVLLIMTASVATQCALLILLRAGAGTYGLIGLFFAGTVAVYIRALTNPGEKLLKTAQLLVSICMLISYLSVIVVIHTQP